MEQSKSERCYKSGKITLKAYRAEMPGEKDKQKVFILEKRFRNSFGKWQQSRLFDEDDLIHMNFVIDEALLDCPTTEEPEEEDDNSEEGSRAEDRPEEMSPEEKAKKEIEEAIQSVSGRRP